MTIKYLRAESAAVAALAAQTVEVALPQADLENLIGKAGSLRPYKLKLEAAASVLIKKLTFSTVSPDDSRMTVLNSTTGWTAAELSEYMNDEEGMDAPRFSVEDGYKLILVVDNDTGVGTETVKLRCKIQNAANTGPGLQNPNNPFLGLPPNFPLSADQATLIRGASGQFSGQLGLPGNTPGMTLAPTFTRGIRQN